MCFLRILELVVCWQLVARISAVEGVKYARVVIVKNGFIRLQSIQCEKTGKGKQEYMASSDYFSILWR